MYLYSMVDTYYSLENVKALLGEAGDTNNDKLDQYGQMADNEINIALAQISNPEDGVPLVLPLDPVTDVVHLLADKLAMGFFYKFESGSVDILEDARGTLTQYIDNTYRRPKFTAVSLDC